MNAAAGQGAMSAFRVRPLAAIFWGGVLAGTFDITQAFIGFGFLGAKPYQILQHIAGGIFGARSYEVWRTSVPVQYFVVLPLSAIGPAQFNVATYITGPIGHPVLVGLPIVLSIRRFSR